jgi:low temperature requirement protein LtrA
LYPPVVTLTIELLLSHCWFSWKCSYYHFPLLITLHLICQGDDFSLTNEQEKWVVDIMLSVTLVKLALVIYCRSFTNEIVKAYAQDHFFDVITNMIGLVAALLAKYIEGWIDPVGAIIVSTRETPISYSRLIIVPF